MEDLKKKFLKLLEIDVEFRYAIAGYLGFSEILKRLESHDKKFNEILSELREHRKILEDHSKILEEHSKILEEHSKILNEHSKALEELSRGLQALGARRGILAEEAFRNAMVGVIEKYFKGKVSKWEYYDSEGIIYGHPSIVEVDLIITDKEHILIEVKSSVHKGDVAELYKIGKLYNKVTGVKPKLAIVSPYIDEKAKELAKKLNIKIHTSLA